MSNAGGSFDNHFWPRKRFVRTHEIFPRASAVHNTMIKVDSLLKRSMLMH